MAPRPDAERDRRGLVEWCRKNSTAQIQARERDQKERRSAKNRRSTRSCHLCARGTSSLCSGTGAWPLPCMRHAEATDSSLPASRRSPSCRWLNTGLLFGERPPKRLRRYSSVNEEQERRGLGRQMEEDSREAMHLLPGTLTMHLYSIKSAVRPM